MIGNMAQDFAKRLYTSTPWINLRFNLIIERGPKCQRCKRVIVDTSKLIGHHKIPLTPNNINDIKVTLNKDNVELICFKCHNVEHKRYGSNHHNVYIVYGSPLSGKNTLVNQLSCYGDMILDLDKLYECISGQALYDKPNNLRFNIFALRDKMLDMIKTRYGDWYDAYIIGGYPNKQERERLARELGAELIYVESTKDECMLRVDSSGKSAEWYKFIDKWWSEYVE
jgi:hypothetical protein